MTTRLFHSPQPPDRKTLRRAGVPLLGLLSLGLWLSGSGACAAERFQLTTRVLSPPEMGAITNWVLQTERGDFGFMPPLGAAVYRDAAERFLSISVPGDLTLRIRACREKAKETAGPRLDREALRAQALENRSQAKVIEEGTAQADSEQGVYFDVLWQGRGGESIQARHAFVRVGGILFEFSTSTSSNRFPRARVALQELLTSFQATDLAATP